MYASETLLSLLGVCTYVTRVQIQTALLNEHPLIYCNIIYYMYVFRIIVDICTYVIYCHIKTLHTVFVQLSVLTVLDLVVFSGISVVRDMHFGIFINAVWCLKLIMLFKHTR